MPSKVYQYLFLAVLISVQVEELSLYLVLAMCEKRAHLVFYLKDHLLIVFLKVNAASSGVGWSSLLTPTQGQAGGESSENPSRIIFRDSQCW